MVTGRAPWFADLREWLAGRIAPWIVPFKEPGVGSASPSGGVSGAGTSSSAPDLPDAELGLSDEGSGV